MSSESPSLHVHVVPTKILLGVWAALLVLTWLTVSVTQVDLDSLNIVIALGIAVVKSVLVALYFMHLRYDRPFHAVIFVTALLFVFVFITFALLDTKEYNPDLIPGYAPEIEQVATPATGAEVPAAATHPSSP
jgi:cytochrome c oxidase subunit 4